MVIIWWSLLINTNIDRLKIIFFLQVYLFLNELNATEVDISANDCYDVNKKFLYSVSFTN